MTENYVPVVNPPIKELKGPLFSLRLPEGWVERSVYCAGGPLAEGFQSSVTVTFEHKPELKDLSTFIDEQVTSLESQLDKFKLLGREETKVASRFAFAVHYTWTHLQQFPLRQTQWFIHMAPNVAVITATAHETAFDELKPLFEKAVASFRSDGPAAPRIIR